MTMPETFCLLACLECGDPERQSRTADPPR
jgi:hypothetical protein